MRPRRPGAQQINFMAERRFETTALKNARTGIAPAGSRISARLRALSFWLAGRAGADPRGAAVWVYPMVDRDPCPAGPTGR